MPRPVSIRVSYRDDASFLLRLEAAVVKDTSQSEGWRKETAGMIRQLSLRLLEADKNKTMFLKSSAAEIPSRALAGRRAAR
jgi:hypothetical protein